MSVDDDAHDGKLTFESDASTDELVDQLAEIKSADSMSNRLVERGRSSNRES